MVGTSGRALEIRARVWRYRRNFLRAIVLTILFSWLLADFISGLVHWWEDRALVGKSSLKFLNGVRLDNERHHNEPIQLTRLSWWENINTTAPIAWTLSLIFFVINAPTILWLTVFCLGFGNLVHRWSHEPKSKRPKVISLLQKTGLLISPSHHSGHHFTRGKLVSRDKSQIRFCVMTSWLNPGLDRVKFWALLNKLFSH